MSAALTVFLDATLKVVRWHGVSSMPEGKNGTHTNQPETGGGHLSWDEVAAKQPAYLQIILPASLVYHSRAQVPSGDRRVIQQSIPWAIEDELASPIEDHHVAWQATDDAEYPQAVAVVSHAIMQQLLQKLDEHGLQADSITSELYLLPEAEADNNSTSEKKVGDQSPSWVYARPISGDDGHVVRQGRWQGGFVPRSAWPPVLMADKNAGQVVEPHWQAAPKTSVNLLQGTYAPQRQEGLNRHQLRWLGLAVAGLLLSVLLVNGLKYWRLQQQQTQLRSVQVQALREAFVDASAAELADPVNAMRSRIKARQQAQGAGSGALMAILSGLSTARKAVPAVRIQGLHWRDNTLEVQVVAPSVEAITRFQRQLAGQNILWRVSTGTREAIADGIKAVLIIKVSS